MLDTLTQYVSVERNDWQFVAPKHPANNQANQNLQTNERRELARKIPKMGSLTKRSIVLAQILSPSGRIHIHHGALHKHMSCFPQSVCWRFPEKSE